MRGNIGRALEGTWARWLNVALGTWLLASELAWHHDQWPRANTWITGLVVLAFALWALWMPSMRWWNTLLGAWLVLASAVLHHASSATRWNNALVGVVILLVSLVPSRPLPDRREAHVESR